MQRRSSFFLLLPNDTGKFASLVTQRTPGVQRNVDDLETNEFADVFGTIAEDLHLTRCDQVCLTGAEDDQAEQHDHGTIGEVPGDPYMEHGGEQIPLVDHPESRLHTFNHAVGSDVLEIIDLVDMRAST